MKVGFIGLGAMGWPMAANLAEAGHDLEVFDLDGDRVADFSRRYRATAVARLTDDWSAETFITMLPNGHIVRSVLLASEGGVALAPGSLVVDMSSSEPAGTRQLGEALAAAGIAFVDAPVSGGVPRATDGTLTIMVGGDAAAVQRARPILEVLGQNIFETGGLGTGHAVKALNNFVAAATFMATAEAMLIGQRFGLDPAVLVEILNLSTGRSFHSDLTMKHHVLNERFATGFALALAAKDVRIAAGLAEEVGIDAPMCRLSSASLSAADTELGPGTDISAAIKAWGKPLPA